MSCLKSGIVAFLLLATIGSTACGGGSGASKVSTPPPAYTIGGTISGLSGSGMVLQNNNASNLAVNADGNFAFRTSVASGSSYSVTVSYATLEPLPELRRY